MRTLKIRDALIETYRRVYALIDKDFDEMLESGEAQEEYFFMKYFVPEKEQEKIVQEVGKEFKLKPFEKRVLSQSYYFGCSPRSTEQEGEENEETNN